MAVFTRRNALLGWAYLQTRRVRRKLKRSSPSAPQIDGRRGKSLIAVGAAALAGTLALLRSRRGGGGA